MRLFVPCLEVPRGRCGMYTCGCVHACEVRACENSMEMDIQLAKSRRPFHPLNSHKQFVGILGKCIHSFGMRYGSVWWKGYTRKNGSNWGLGTGVRFGADARKFATWNFRPAVECNVKWVDLCMYYNKLLEVLRIVSITENSGRNKQCSSPSHLATKSVIIPHPGY